MKNLCFVLVASCLLFASCGSDDSDGGLQPTPTKPVPPPVTNPVNPDGNGIIGDDFLDEDVVFPETQKARFISVIKLKTPALLASAVNNGDGTFTIDDDAKTALLSEQEQLEQALQKISPDIKVLYRYRMVLNGFSVDAPQELAEAISQLDVDFIEADERFAQPKVLKEEASNADAGVFDGVTSTSFVGVDKVHSSLTVVDADGNTVPVRGQGIRVGVIDSGVDYTHKMFGGPGTEAAFKAVDPNTLPTDFPTARVVGGYDFAGGSFNPSSHIFSHKIPNPDANPIDQSGHGTHVAGTTAGQGDGVNTYDGVAPEAEIHALKVFGDGGGGTSDQIVIAALEYAADPNGDLALDDKLDVVNLSLGGGFGKPHNLYAQAIANLSRGGTVVVAAAGNSGPVANIVGAPSTSPEAISVAASVDGMDHNWKFPAIEFTTPANPLLLVEFAEGTITEPLVTAGAVEGKLVAIGTAEVDLTEEQKAELKGHIALIDRGGVAFGDKIKRAVDAGALGVVMANNQDGPPIRMGGDPGLKFPIPGVMIAKDMGDLLKAEMKVGDAIVRFQSQLLIEKPQLIDTLTGFSSQGPRELDALIKPEISAPGQGIMSAEMGSGTKGVRFGGTSMSAPLVAGAVALIQQYHKNLTAKQVKSLVMNSGVLISDADGVDYPISRQGAGRVDVYRALTGGLAFSEPSLSLGKIQVETSKSQTKTLTVKNLSGRPGTFGLTTKTGDNIQVTLSASSLTLDAGESAEIDVTVEVSALDPNTTELNAFVQWTKDGEVMGSLPILAMVNRQTNMAIESLVVEAPDMATSPGANAQITISNTGLADGQALLFNLLGQDDRKLQDDPTLTVTCDLESSGYRIVQKGGVSVLQVAAKLYNPVTNWRTCDLNVEFDLDGDNKSDKEIIGSNSGGLPGLDAPVQAGFGSLLVDSKAFLTIYEKYLEEIAQQPEQPPRLDFSPSLLGARVFNSFEYSTLAVVEVDLPTLLPMSQTLDLKVSVSYNGNSADIAERSDSLSDGSSPWKSINIGALGSGYHNLPEIVEVAAGGTQTVSLLKGRQSAEALISYFPRNAFILKTAGNDQQASIAEPEFETQPVAVP